MTQYEINRHRYLAVPGGSIRPLPTCLCFPEAVAGLTPDETVYVSGVEWAIFPRCPIHGDCYKQPISGPGIDEATAGTVATREVL